MHRRTVLAGIASAATLPGLGAAAQSGDDEIRYQRFEQVGAETGADPAIEIDTSANGRLVSVEGVVQAPNSRHRARLESATFDGEELHVVVTTREPKRRVAGTPAIVGLEYEATFLLSAAPSDVTVEHDAYDDTTERVSLDGGIVDQSFAVLETASSADPEIDVTFGDDPSTVEVDGVILGSNGCMEASLERATFDGEELTVVVGTTDGTRRENVACTMAIEPSAYEATFVLDEVPRRVTVQHDGVDDTSTTARPKRRRDDVAEAL